MSPETERMKRLWLGQEYPVMPTLTDRLGMHETALTYFVLSKINREGVCSLFQRYEVRM